MKQTEELFRNGRVTSGGGRAKALVNGTALVQGRAFADGTDEYGGHTIGEDKDDDINDEFEDVIDWIETVLDRADRLIDKYEKQADNVYKTWSSRETTLYKQISAIEDAITKQKQAKTYYGNKLNSFDWGTYGNGYEDKIKNGTIATQKITDENLSEKIKEYTDLYEKWLEADEAIIQLEEDRLSRYEEHFNQVQDKYDSILQGFDHTETMLNEYISQAEERGHITSKKYYAALISNEESKISKLKQQQAALIAARDEAEANGIAKNSQAWYDMCAEIDSVTQAIESGTTSLIEYNNAIRDIDWEIFDLIQERISDVTSEADFLIELMSNKKLFDDDGKLTEQGVATMALHGQNYNTYMYQADDYGAKVAEIDKKIASGELDGYSKDVMDKRQEYVELQREAILNAEDEKQAMMDLVQEGYDVQLDALQELIDKKQEALESERDLYDYQKKVKEQTEEIANIEKMLSSYAGDNSEEAKAKVQELKVSLQDASENLEETQYDKFISDQTKLLDDLYSEYEQILTTSFDNIDGRFEQLINEINIAAGEGGGIASSIISGSATIGETLKSEVEAVGTKLSTAMSNIWLADGSGKAVIDLYGQDFQKKTTTTNNALNNIKADVAAMVDDVDKDAQKKTDTNKTSSSSVADPTKGNNGNNSNNNTQNNASSNQRTEKEHYGVALAVWNGNYGWGNGDTRKKRLKEKGFDTSKVQSIVNRMDKEGYVHTAAWIKRYYGITDKDLKKYSFNSYATGKYNFLDDEVAWTQENGKEFIVRPSDGAILTPIAKKDSILNAAASNNIWQMANSPTEFIKDNLNLGAVSTPNNASVQNNTVQHFDKIVFNMPDVKNYEEMLAAMQKDKNFERLIMSMSIDRIAGKSSLAKGKAVR